MLQTFRKAFQIEDIRRKILYTLAMLFVVRLGSQLPTPGVDPTYIQNFFANQTGDSFNFFNAFTGGSFETMSIFALSITPYITSSIIIQLLTIAIPKLEEMQKEGEDGRKKLTALTRYVTVVLALIESTAMAVGFGRQGLLEKFNFVNAAIVGIGKSFQVEADYGKYAEMLLCLLRIFQLQSPYLMMPFPGHKDPPASLDAVFL